MPSELLYVSANSALRQQRQPKLVAEVPEEQQSEEPGDNIEAPIVDEKDQVRQHECGGLGDRRRERMVTGKERKHNGRRDKQEQHPPEEDDPRHKDAVQVN